MAGPAYDSGSFRSTKGESRPYNRRRSSQERRGGLTPCKDRTSAAPGPLTGIRVIELADEQAEYCGLTLAGLGADVVKVEPPGGSPTRRIGPFYQDREDPERSLFFWQYNRGKRSIVLDLHQGEDRERFRSLVATADVLLESTPRGELDGFGLGADALMQQYPSLIVARVSPFGDHGPWADFKASDLVHLALGGVMMNCGYDPAPGGKYDLPPIAPQMWHAFHIAGEQLAVAIIAALLYRWRTGKGQQPVVRDPRGGGEIHRGRPHVVGDATRPGPAPDLPSRARNRLAAPVHRAHEGWALGDGQSGDAPR